MEVQGVMPDDVVRSYKCSPKYCRDLDTITLRDLIDSKGKLIPEDPQSCCNNKRWDRYQGVFDHNGYGVNLDPLHGAYNHQSMLRPQYDQ
ncbi:hypothetical protein Tco_0065149 [Tanacetum coccineum]